MNPTAETRLPYALLLFQGSPLVPSATEKGTPLLMLPHSRNVEGD